MAVAPTTRRVQHSQVPVMAHARAVWNPQPRLELTFVRALVYACIQIGSVELVEELSADLWKGCEQIRKVRAHARGGEVAGKRCGAWWMGAPRARTPRHIRHMRGMRHMRHTCHICYRHTRSFPPLWSTSKSLHAAA